MKAFRSRVQERQDVSVRMALRGLWRAFRGFWFGEVNTTSLALFRIAFGVIWLSILISSYPNWLRFYGPQGVVPLDYLADAAFDGGRLSIFAHTRDPFWTMAVYWLALAAAAMFTVGWKTRLATIALYGLVISMVNRAPSLVHGEDQVSRQLLFFACFAPLGDQLSVDAALTRRAGRATGGRAPAWSLRLMQLAIVFIYVFSVPAKPSDDVAWLDGSAVYYVMASANWGRFPALAPLFYGGFLSALATYATLLVEAAFPLLVWFKRTRPYVLVALALLQLGLTLLVDDVMNFNLVVLSGLILFVPGDSAERALERARRLMWAEGEARLPRPA